MLKPVLEELDNKYRCRRRRIPESFVKNRPNDALRIKCFKEDGTRHSLHEEVAFLQAWLFFGVLAELNKTTSVPTPNLHVEGTPDVLSTAALDTLVHRWIAALEAFDDDSRRQRWGQMLQVVLHVVSLQTCISTVRSQVEESLKLTYDECKVLLAIRVLFRAILLTLALSSPQSESDLHLLMQPTLSQSFPADWDELKDFATQEMLATGWCKSECQHLEQYDGAYNFFATKLTVWEVANGS
ncbi:hypothetical protein VNI00_010176 [Paramarasmius palmivorus]|uniref:Uncharacterized protein n=1 Tax=Paramarasmius palmivorus TaxID=297713 RepID=A0AAW0CLQ2_9AGAR